MWDPYRGLLVINETWTVMWTYRRYAHGSGGNQNHYFGAIPTLELLISFIIAACPFVMAVSPCFMASCCRLIAACSCLIFVSEAHHTHAVHTVFHHMQTLLHVCGQS